MMDRDTPEASAHARRADGQPTRLRHFRTQSMQVKSGRSPLETKPPIVMQREHVLYK